MNVSSAIRRISSPAAVAVWCALPSHALAQHTPEPLLLAQAIALARDNNPSYLMLRNQISSAQWEVRSAYGSLLPSINSSTAIGYTSGGERRLESVVLTEQPAQYSSRYNLSMSLSLSGTALLAPSIARAQQRAAEQSAVDAAVALESDVTQQYLSVLEARAALRQARRELERTAEHVRLAEAQLEVGAGTQLDVSRAAVQRGQAEVRLVQAENTAANEAHLLGQVLGVRLPEDVALSEEFSLFEPSWSADELVAAALSGSPALQATRAQADAASIRARAARSTYLPSVSFRAGLSGFVSQAGSSATLIEQQLRQAQDSYISCVRQNTISEAVGLTLSECQDPSVPAFQQQVRQRVMTENRGFPFDYIRQPLNASITISLPIFNGLQREQQVEEARIARLNAEYQVRAQELQIEAQVESSLRNLETAYRTALMQQQVRETAEEELRLARGRFQFGATSSVEVVNAQARLAEAERAEIAAIYAFHRSLAVLEAALGHPLERGY